METYSRYVIHAGFCIESLYMRDDEIQKKTDAVMSRQIEQHGYAAPVDVLMDLGVLDRKKYLDWRNGRVPYLEKVCTMNLSRLAKVSHAIRHYAWDHHLKPSYTVYRKYGKGKQTLRFSRYGRADVEKNYATHYVDSKRIRQIKEEKQKEKQQEKGSD